MSIQLIIKLKAPRKTSHIYKASAQLSHLKYQRPVPNSAPRKTSHIYKASAQLSHLKYQRPVPNSALAQHLIFPMKAKGTLATVGIVSLKKDILHNTRTPMPSRTNKIARQLLQLLVGVGLC